jgi:phenylacetate-CoA ligase
MPSIPPYESEFWDKGLECMKPADRERFIVKKLKHLLKYAYDNSLYYHETFKSIGLDIDSINSLEEFSRKVPITTKAILRKEQENYPPFGRIMVSGGEARLVLASSGTTGRPTYVPFSYEDLEMISEAHARIMWSFGVRPGMRILIAAMFTLYAGAWGVYLGAQRLGLSIVPAGAGSPGATKNAAIAAKDLKPEILYGTPSYILHFLETSKNLGIDPAKDYSFRIVFGSGEPGLSLPSVKRKIKSSLGDHVRVIDTGSMVEATPWMTNAECRFEEGMHLWQDIVYTEVVDSETAELTSYGEEGVLTYTPLERKLYPIIRYYSGDLTMWTDDPGSCGRTYPRLPKGIYGRVDDMIVVKGIKLFPSIIQEVLEAHPSYNGEFRVILGEEAGKEYLKLVVEVTQEAWSKASRDKDEFERLSKELSKFIRDRVGVSALVEITPPGTLERSTHKARRIVDERSIYKELLKLRGGV